MKKLFIANWKSHKTGSQARAFLQEFKTVLPTLSLENKEIIICPSFSLLSTCCTIIRENNLPIFLGAQDISEFGEGAFTGEVNGQQIREFADYVIIGHSERRRYFSETEETREKKVREAKKSNLKSILCVPDEKAIVYPDVFSVAYEPPSAISTFGVGKPDEPEHIKNVLKALREKTQSPLLYGGSVDQATIESYDVLDEVQGFLIGAASLDVKHFSSLLSTC